MQKIGCRTVSGLDPRVRKPRPSEWTKKDTYFVIGRPSKRRFLGVMSLGIVQPPADGNIIKKSTLTKKPRV